MSIGQEWKSSHVYIVASHIFDGTDCEDDARGPSYLKICDVGWREWVFYVYRIHPYKEGDNPLVGQLSCFEYVCF